MGNLRSLCEACIVFTLLAASSQAVEQTAGIQIPGSPVPPEGGLLRLGAANNLAADEDFLRCVVSDPAAGYAWFGTSTSPGQIIKVAYAGPNLPPRRVASLILQPGEDSLFTGVIDRSAGYAYFGTFTSPARVIKVALGNGDVPPLRIGAVTLDPGEDQLMASVIDAAAGYAYFGTRTAPGRVVKMALGAGNAPPTRVAVTPLAFGEDLLRSAVIDAASGHAWFGTFSFPGRVVKVALGAGPSPPQRVDGIALDFGEDKLTSAVIDAASGFAWFGTYTSPGKVVKVALGDAGAPPSRVGTETLMSGEDQLASASLSAAAPGYALFGCETFAGTPGTIVKVALGSGPAPPSRVGAVTLSATEDSVISAADAGGALFFGTNTQPGQVIQVVAGAAGQAPARQSALTLGAGENDLQSAVIDAANGYGWFGTATFPGQVVKVKLGRAGQPPQRIAALRLDPGEDRLTCAAGDIANGYAYFGTDTARARVVKVALGAGDAPPVRIGSLLLDADEHNLRSAAIDTANGHAYFGTAVRQPGKVIKVALGSGANLPTRIGATTARADEWDFQSAVINGAGTHALFGTGQYYGETGAGGKIVKVTLGSGASPPSRASVLALPAGEESLHTAVADPLAGYAWFGSAGTNFAQGSAVKVAFEAGDAPPRRVGSALFAAGETPLAASMIDVPAGYALFGSGNRNVIKVSLGIGETAPQRTGGIELLPNETTLHCAVGDPANGLAWFGTSTAPGNVVSVSYSQKGFIKGSRVVLAKSGTLTKVHFYSHRAAGHVRLALYARSGPDRILVWQSPEITNTANGAWITVPAASGTPTAVSLAAGTYDLAWQVNTTADVPGYVAGAPGDGFLVPAAFGPFPPTLTEGAGNWATTAETWAAYLSYEPGAFQIIEVRVNGNTLTITWNSIPGNSYQVQRSDALQSWSDAGTPVLATGPTTDWSEAIPPGVLRRFYRVVAQ